MAASTLVAVIASAYGTGAIRRPDSYATRASSSDPAPPPPWPSGTAISGIPMATNSCHSALS